MKTLFRTLVLALGLSAATAFAAPVNVNTADAATIAENLKHVGPKTAEAIVAYREANGPFKSAEDLLNVKGVGQRILDANKGDIRTAD